MTGVPLHCAPMSGRQTSESSPVQVAADAVNATAAGAGENGVAEPAAAVGHLRELIAIARGRRRPLIHLQHNPDPDALASAEALRFLFQRLFGVETVLAYTGRVGRVENRAMLRHLNIKIRPAFRVDYDKHDLLIVVDTHPGSGTCKIPDDRLPDVVVDHHPARHDLSHIPFLLVDPSFGSTSTMVGALFVDNGIPYDARIATALTYGIRTDTLDLSRSSSPHDDRIFREMFGQADKRALAKIERARVPQEYFVVLERGLRRAQVSDFAVTTWLGDVDHSDSVAEIADLLFRLDGIRFAMVAGWAGDRLCASLRSMATKDIRAGDVAHDISGGFGGGHDTFAALQMPMDADVDHDEAYQELRDRFLKAVRAKKSLTRSLAVPPDIVTTEPPDDSAAGATKRHRTQATNGEST